MKPAAAKWNPFRTRNVVGVALGLGILAGIWLGDFFKGFGWGPGQGPGQGPGSGPSAGDSAGDSSSDDTTALIGHRRKPSDSDAESSPEKNGGLIKVLIDDRSYYLLRGDGLEDKEAIALDDLVRLIENAKPNEDGLRAVIERTSTSRPTAEIRLSDALKEAGIPKNSVYQPPASVD